MIDINMIRAGHVPTFLKSFRSFTTIVSIFFRMRSKRSVFFRNDGIVLDRSIRSRERTIFPPLTRPALVGHL